MKLRCALHGRILSAHGFEHGGVGARDKNILAAGFLTEHRLHNFRDLLWRFAFSEHDLRVSLAQRLNFSQRVALDFRVDPGENRDVCIEFSPLG